MSLTTTWHTSPRKPLQKKPDPADPIIETMNHVDGDFSFCKYFSYLKYCTIFILFRRVSQLKRKKLLKRSALQLAWLNSLKNNTLYVTYTRPVTPSRHKASEFIQNILQSLPGYKAHRSSATGYVSMKVKLVRNKFTVGFVLLSFLLLSYV